MSARRPILFGRIRIAPGLWVERTPAGAAVRAWTTSANLDAAEDAAETLARCAAAYEAIVAELRRREVFA